MLEKKKFFPFVNKLVLLMAAVFALGATQSIAHADDNNDDDYYSRAVENLDFVEMGVTGKAKLCISESDLKGKMHARHLRIPLQERHTWALLPMAIRSLSRYSNCRSSIF